jgi:hypothetical protein
MKRIGYRVHKIHFQFEKIEGIFRFWIKVELELDRELKSRFKGNSGFEVIRDRELKSRFKGSSDLEVIGIGSWKVGLKAVQVVWRDRESRSGVENWKVGFTSQNRMYRPTGGRTEMTSALMYRMDLAENLHTYVFWGAEQYLNDSQSANYTPWSCFGSKCGVRLVCRENGSERNTSVGALLFFAHLILLFLSIAKGLSMWPETGSRSRVSALRVI